MPMSTDVQVPCPSCALNRVAQGRLADRSIFANPFFEKLVYSGSRTGFRLASER